MKMDALVLGLEGLLVTPKSTSVNIDPEARPHLYTFLNECKKLFKKIYVASALSEATTRRVIQQLEIEHYFDDVFNREDLLTAVGSSLKGGDINFVGCPLEGEYGFVDCFHWKNTIMRMKMAFFGMPVSEVSGIELSGEELPEDNALTESYVNLPIYYGDEEDTRLLDVLWAFQEAMKIEGLSS